MRRLRWRGAWLVATILPFVQHDVSAQSGVRDTSRVAGDERSTLRLASDGAMTLTLGGYLQVDGRLMSGTLPTPSDGLLLRRARLVFDARMPSGWHLRLQPDFGQSRVLVQDAYVGYDHARASARIGRFRPAFGVERFQSSATLLHGERSLVNSLMPSRSFGAQATVRRGALTLAIGGFRTPIGAAQQVVDTDGDDQAVPGSGHDLLTRVAWAPRRGARYADVQVALLTGRERGETNATGVSRLLTVGQQPLLAFRNEGTMAGTALADGARNRLSMGGVIGDARTMIGLEGALFTQEIRLDRVRRELTASGFTVRAAHVRGGTRRPTQEIAPAGRRGAIDLGIRVGALGAWGDDINAVVTRRSATHVASAGAAVGWIPTALTRLSLAYDMTKVRRERGIREHFLVLRVQQGF